MARDIKYIPARELKELGFLQEANRLFFHPHGLALELTRLPDGRGTIMVGFCEAHMEAIRSLIAAERARRSLGDSTDDLDGLTACLDQAAPAQPGDCYISGVWDYRDDPEGICYGDWPENALEKVAAVRLERDNHRAARELLFRREGHDLTDIEPVGWIDPNPPAPSEVAAEDPSGAPEAEDAA